MQRLRDPLWVKICIVLSAVLLLAAFGIFGYTMHTDNPNVNSPNFIDPAPGYAIAAP